MGDLDGDGRAALVEAIPDATQQERQQARRTCATYALTGPAPHQTLAELLDQLDLRPIGEEPH